MHISQSPAPSARHHHALARLNEIGQQFLGVGIAHNGAAGNTKNDILPFGTVHLLARPSLAGAGLEVLAVAILDQRVLIRRGLDIDASTTPPVAAVRSAKRHIFLSAKMDRAIPPITRFDKNFGMIVKHDLFYRIPETFCGMTCTWVHSDLEYITSPPRMPGGMVHFTEDKQAEKCYNCARRVHRKAGKRASLRSIRKQARPC